MMNVASSVPITSPGSAFPISSSGGRNGVTSSWSNVPASRSRATESAVTTSVTTSVSSATIPGTMNQRDNRFSLYNARVSSRPGACGKPWAAAQSRLKRMRTSRT